MRHCAKRIVARSRSRQGICLASAGAAAILMAQAAVQAATGTWNASPTNNLWVAGGGDANWSSGAGTTAGATSGTTNADTATFLTSSTTTIDVNAPVNVKFIVFGDGTTTAPSAFTIGASGPNAGNAISITNAGSIGYFSPNSGTYAAPVTQTINAPLVLLPASATTAGTVTFNLTSGSNSIAGNTNMVFAGNISGGTTSAGITLVLGRSVTQSLISGDISDGGAAAGLAVTKNASNNGNWKLSGNNTFTGKVSVLGGTVEVASFNSVATNATLGTTHLASSNLGAPITVATGTIDLGTNSSLGILKYVGNGEVTDRVINIGGNGNNQLDASGGGALVLVSDLAVNGTSTDTGKTLLLTGTNTNDNEFRGSIANGAGSRVVSVSKSGAGTWVLSGNNNFTGSMVVSAGTLGIGSDTALGAGQGLSLGAATIAARNGDRSLGGNLALTGGATTISGTSALTFAGSLYNTGVNNLAVLAGATLTINGESSGISSTVTDRTLTFSGAGIVNLNGAIGNNSPGGSSTLSGLTYAGSGSMTLGGANTFNGKLAVTSGRVYVNNASGSGTGFGSVTVSGTGRLSGTGRIAPTVAAASLGVSSGGVLAPGDAAGSGDLEVDLGGTTGVITLGTGSTFRFSLNANGGSFAAPGQSSRLLLTNSTVSDVSLAAAGNGVGFGGVASDGTYKLIDTDLAAATVSTDVYGNLTYDESTGLVSAGLTALNLPDGGTASFYVGTATNGGDVGDLYVQVVGVPEPAGLGLIALAAGGMLRRTRRKL